MEAIRELTGGIGADRVIDAVGIDAQRPRDGPAAENLPVDAETLEAARKQPRRRATPIRGSGWPAMLPVWWRVGW